MADKHTPTLQHVAVSENGELRWMSGRKPRDCELYAMADGALLSPLYVAAPELMQALEELLIDMRIAQSNMRLAASRDPKWEGCAEAIQPRVDAARVALSKARGEQV